MPLLIAMGSSARLGDNRKSLLSLPLPAWGEAGPRAPP
jgi:hypothetical protein